MPCNYTASRPVINSYLQTIELAYLRDLAPNQLNDLCDQCVWQPAPAAKGSTAERKDKTNLLAWIARNMPELKHPSLKMETQALLERSITLRRLESGEAGEDAVQIKQEDGELLNEHPDTKPLRCSSSSKKQRVQDQQLISSGGEDRVVHDLHGTASSSQLSASNQTGYACPCPPKLARASTATNSYRSPQGIISGPLFSSHQPTAASSISLLPISRAGQDVEPGYAESSPLSSPTLKKRQPHDLDVPIRDQSFCLSSPSDTADGFDDTADGFEWLNTIPDSDSSDSGVEFDDDDCDQREDSKNNDLGTGNANDRPSSARMQLVSCLAAPVAAILQVCEQGKLDEALRLSAEVSGLIAAAVRKEIEQDEL